MILNDRQQTIATKQASDLRNAIASFDREGPIVRGIDPAIVDAQLGAMEAELAEIENDIRAYHRLKTAPPPLFRVDSIAEIPRMLVSARIALGLTQRDLAERLGMKEQQIQRYEAELYAGASLSRVADVATALGLQLRGAASSRALEKEPRRQEKPLRGRITIGKKGAKQHAHERGRLQRAVGEE